MLPTRTTVLLFVLGLVFWVVGLLAPLAGFDAPLVGMLVYGYDVALVLLFFFDAVLARAGFAVDSVICPEASVSRYVSKLIEYPEALQVLQFSQGRVSLIAVRAFSGGPMVRHAISELRQLVPGVDMRIVAIYRTDERGMDQQILCDGDTRIEPGDEVFVLAATRDIRRVLDTLRRRDPPVRRVMIAGGGRVGLRLARELRGQYRVKLIELDARRCEYLVTQLPADTLVLQGDSTDEELLEEENVRDVDLFLALTSDDEDNIMACLLAKRMGARRVPIQNSLIEI